MIIFLITSLGEKYFDILKPIWEVFRLQVDLYEQFFINSSTAYSCHKVIFNGEGSPIDYEFIAFNKAYEELMELKGENLLHKRFYEVFPNSWDDQEKWERFINDIICNQKPSQIDIKKPNVPKWLRIISFPLKNDTYGCIYFDVTKEYMQDNEIEGFLKVNIDLLSVMDTDGYYIRVNQAYERILGYKAEEIEGKSFKLFVHEEDIPKTNHIIEQLKDQKVISSFVNRILHKDGTYRYLEWRSQMNGKYIYSSARDITVHRNLEQELCEKNRNLARLTEELKEKNKILKTLAITDDLTGVYNRHFLNDKIKMKMDQADLEHRPISMIIVDLDYFKKVNDTYGHPVGDEVLKSTGNLLKQMIRYSDMIVRLGGEEFVIILPNTTVDGAYNIAERIRRKIEQYDYPVAGRLTASLGVAQKKQSESFESWYERTDSALYEAKESKRNCVAKAFITS